VKKHLGTLLRILVSALLAAILIDIAVRQHVMTQLRNADGRWVIGGGLLLGAGWIVNSIRWGLLLLAAGVVEKPAILVALYFIGNFFSQILPTGAGGDAVRMWAISRRHGKPAAAIVATFQERLVGMGVSCALGLCVGAVYFDRLPPGTRVWMMVFEAVMVAGVSIGLYPRLPLSIARRFWAALAKAWSLEVMGESKIGRKIGAGVEHVANLPPLTVTRLVPILLVGLIGILFSIAEWWALGRAEGIGLPYAVYCLIVPMVWIISMTPSLGGVGVREGGFVLLMSLFGIAKSLSLAVAALYLIVQTLMAGIGGLLLLGAVLTGNWKKPQSA
jgi:uncharacterized protein (TIRG00374 family)